MNGKTLRISRHLSAGCVLAVAMAMLPGCGSSPPQAANPDAARTALRAALDAWKRGDPPESLGKASPAIQVIDWRWRSGAKLVRYEIKDADRSVGADLRCPVQLWIGPNPDKPVLEVAEYNVTTDPSLTVSRAGDH